MKTEDLVEGLNQYIEDIRKIDNITSSGHFVLQRMVTQHPTFKAYKEYRNTVWYVLGPKKVKAISVNYIDKAVSDEQEMNIVRKVNVELVKGILVLQNSPEFELYIKGTI